MRVDHQGAACLLFAVAFAFTSISAQGQVFDRLSEGRPGSLELKGIRIPIGADASRPSVRLEIGKVSLERARVGVFRVGLLPQLVFQDVRFHVLGGQSDTDWSRDLRVFLHGERNFNRAKISGLTILNPSRALQIQAAEASVRPGATHIALHGVKLRRANSAPSRYPAATLRLVGPQAGCLELPGGNNRTIRIGD